MKKILISFICIILFSSGIIRHDIPEAEYVALANQPQFDCAGFITNSKDSSLSGFCFLVNNKFILSAAHVFYSDQLIGSDTLIRNGKRIIYPRYLSTVGNAQDYLFTFNGKSYKGKKIIKHPIYNDSVGDYDLAIIELYEEVIGIDPVQLNITRNEKNSRVVGVGYGVSGIANKPETVLNLMKKIGGENIIDKIGGYKDLATKERAEMFADFDSPNGCKKCNKMGDSKPLKLEFITGGGDSGSGLFREKDGTWSLIGICTGGSLNVKQMLKTGYYGKIGTWTRVSLYTDWIEKTTTYNKK